MNGDNIWQAKMTARDVWEARLNVAAVAVLPDVMQQDTPVASHIAAEGISP
jgi:hypothetical protein